MRRSSVGVSAFIGLMLLASAAVAPPSNIASLEVFVVDEAGLPIQGAPAIIETSGGETYVLVTNGEGWAHADLKVRGQTPLDLTVSTLGAQSAGLTLGRGESASLTLGPCSRGYEWAIVD